MGFSPWVVLVMGYLLSRLAENRLHAQNYSYLIYRGAEEWAEGESMRLSNAPYFLLALAAIERFVAPRALPAGWALGFFTGAVVCFVLRLSSVLSLQRMWTQRVLTFPGMRLVRRGPYRFLQHPEYWGRLLEFVLVCAVGGAYLTAALSAVVLGRSVLKLSAVEAQKHREFALLEDGAGSQQTQDTLAS